MEENKKICLSQPVVYDVNGRDVKVYPISLEKVLTVQENLAELENETDMKKQVKTLSEAVFEILKDYNTITLDEIKKFPFTASLTILQAAFGGLSVPNVGDDLAA